LPPVEWQHINLNDEYAFSEGKTEVDLVGLFSDIEPLDDRVIILAA